MKFGIDSSKEFKNASRREQLEVAPPAMDRATEVDSSYPIALQAYQATKNARKSNFSRYAKPGTSQYGQHQAMPTEWIGGTATQVVAETDNFFDGKDGARLEKNAKFVPGDHVIDETQRNEQPVLAPAQPMTQVYPGTELRSAPMMEADMTGESHMDPAEAYARNLHAEVMNPNVTSAPQDLDITKIRQDIYDLAA